MANPTNKISVHIPGLGITHGISSADFDTSIAPNTGTPANGVCVLNTSHVPAAVGEVQVDDATGTLQYYANGGMLTLQPSGGAGVVLNPMVSNLDAGTHKVTNLATPTADADAATKAYVDANDTKLVHISLSSAQIKALHTTPVEVLAAVPDKVIAVTNTLFEYVFGTTAYTGGGNVTLTERGLNVSNNTATQALLQGGASFVYQGNNNNNVATKGAALMITAAGADFAAGDGTAELYVLYRLV